MDKVFIIIGKIVVTYLLARLVDAGVRDAIDYGKDIAESVKAKKTP